MPEPNTYVAAPAKLLVDPVLVRDEYGVFWEIVTPFWYRNYDGLAV